MFRLNGEIDSIMYHRSGPTTKVPLFLNKNSLRVHAKPLIHHVRLVAADDIPVRLSSRPPTNLLDRRLDGFARHVFEHRENELSRGRTAQAAVDAER